MSIVTRETLLYNKTNIKQLNIDSLPPRKNSHKNVIYYDRPQKNVKRCKICVDVWDNAKILRTMENRYSPNEQPCGYYLDVKNKQVRKLKEVVRYYKKHNLIINSELVYYGKKSVAIKKLSKLLSA